MRNKYDEDSIDVLEGLDPVRKRPGMYIGSTGTKGLNHLIYEIVDNAVDEHLAGFCTTIYITLEKDGSCTVKDDGRGVPVGIHKKKHIPAARLVFTTLHAGGKFNNSSYKTSGGLHGVGSSVVNALSSWMDVEIVHEGLIYHDHYEKGKPTLPLDEHGYLPTIGKASGHGTTICFHPDKEVFEKTRFKEDEIKNRMKETAYLNPGLTIYYEDKRAGTEEKVTFHEPEGIIGYVKDLNKEKQILHEPIYFQDVKDGIRVECAMQYTSEFSEDIVGFCNNIYTSEGGTHLTGFKTALTALLNTYARQIGVLKNRDENFTGADIRNGLTAVISIKHPDPRFEGQTKTKLDNPDAGKAVSRVTTDQLTLYFDRHLETLKDILSCAEKAAKLRKSEAKSKEVILGKKKFSFDSNGKFANCEKRDPTKCEIFIVEGESAGGSAKMGRDRSFQAIMPIRGKSLNVEKASIGKVLSNVEIRTMVYAFGCGFGEGYGNDFDLSKLKYDKIIIMADADIDGAHIATLLLTLFYRYMPDLIHAGHVYLASPPLYKAIPSRGDSEYLYDDRALAHYQKTHKNFTLQRYKGLGEMSPEQLWETTMNPDTRILKRVNIENARYASEVTATLMGSDVSARKEFIYKNAERANIDS